MKDAGQTCSECGAELELYDTEKLFKLETCPVCGGNVLVTALGLWD